MFTTILKDFTWNETQHCINIKVPVPGLLAKGTQIFATDKYIKINFSKYFWEIFLKDSVDTKKSSSLIKNGDVNFTLIKNEPKLWYEISEDLPDKQLKIHRRALEQSKFLQLNAKEQENKLQRKQELKTIAITEQIQLEARAKEQICQEIEKEKLKVLATFAKSEETAPAVTKPEYMPPIRNRGNIRIQFTPGRRSFPTREATPPEK